MRKFILLILACTILSLLCACAPTNTIKRITEADIKAEIETLLEPQIKAYEEAFGIDDLSVDIQFKKCEITDPSLDSRGNMLYHGFVYCSIRDIIVSPTFSKSLSQGEFTDDMLKQLSAIEFTYPDFTWGDYKVSVLSTLACPIFSDAQHNEYSVSAEVLLKGSTIVYIATDAQLEYDAKVGDNIYSVIASGSSNASSKTKCPNCNGSGYVKYYYGSSDLEAILDGYDPYTVGECTMCDGKGH